MAELTLQDHIDNVSDEFDFPRVYRVMQHLNWQWANTEGGTPTIGEMRRLVRKLMKDAYNDCIRYGYDEYTIGTGGFEAYYNKEYEFFEVKFVVCEWRTDYRNE